MSNEEIVRKKKQVEVNVVEMKIEVSELFFNNMEKAKKQVADKRGYDITYGEYLEEALNDLVKMVDDYAYKIQEASEIIKRQDEMLNGPIEEEGIVIEQKPIDPETEQEETEPPVELYAHIEKDEAKEIMYG